MTLGSDTAAAAAAAASNSSASTPGRERALATLLIHADAGIAAADGAEIAPAISVSTTFRRDQSPHVYSRMSQPTRDRAEAVLGALEHGHAVLYSTGLAAIHAAFVFYNPKRILIDGGYFGTVAVAKLIGSKFGTRIESLKSATIQAGDLVWLETPKNPCCDIQDVAEFAKRAHAVGAIVVADATFAPPPLQYCLDLGADMVMHATTKYLGGHSDLLGGALVVRDRATQEKLLNERSISGAVPGSLETWLLLRSLRTLELRVTRQSQSAAILAAWFASGRAPFVKRVWHPSLPTHPLHDVAVKQMKGSFGGVLSIELDTEHRAVKLPDRLRLFADATSLGGVESLIEWRYRVDQTISPCLLRVSVGLEDPQDLIADMEAGLASLADVTGPASKL
ncbi:cystathionine beta-lyase [Capsaspora owczarzaki ATCC 30864]|uniref:Cystathionine beta-lyase n=1 Tax=Capsaspora owczarzaki (strain ATCC 30864) TaxID=595528 RepID=A0A0D2VSC5_CAPO3|nr:cystathionine beta-lyase [Capsaspora owczarzaki ATCC 30864]KJE93972.1 cystathionine beta-lyase [Capsaspora owczarzaki ATCC 30864]|eukprot:XP_004347428.1 cystathionine beta-lyase [Capsaspora owczarzaki ATCC 30864]